ncbi:hypothetical protein NW756_002774 [Fusarium oxysporum]|nr:hypothetical protein NW753_006851 [Fusarium oxysporum]KAJ4061335.1 hypothetical protein NW763_004718 [Fusarium oxysporum]KAJ4098190.1 hypothetical protein NW756_002774 [Fusarium oxysporum]
MHFPHAVVAVALSAQASAHGILGEIITDGVRNAAFQTDFIYRKQNGNPTPTSLPGLLRVAAGGKVDFFWPEWPHDVGPVLTYIAACGGDCASAERSALSWVKIDEAGYDGQWVAEKLMNNNFTWTATVPSTIAPGNYVFRHEIINLHSGAEKNGAQLYPQCVNIEITGTGTDTPQGVPGVELYKADDAGILFDPTPKTFPAESLPSGNATLPEVTAAAPTTLSTRIKAVGTRTRILGSRTRTLGSRPTAVAEY